MSRPGKAGVSVRKRKTSELLRLLSSTELEAPKAGETRLPAAARSSQPPRTACDSRMSEESGTRLTDGRTDEGGGGVGGAAQGPAPGRRGAALTWEKARLRRRGVRSLIPAAAVRD